jgi:cytochrome d ubiquinol oxidase subunit II
MEIFWFIAVGFMLTMYVILDGFDLGAGIIHLFAAKTDDERRTVLNAIGPVWDGNEVWLLAAGGTLYFAFPKLYASSFSGFYLPLMIVLWLLMLRAIGIEFRHHVRHPMWQAFWDATFAGASILLTIFFGAALGNVVRGVPLNAEGYFFLPLWTTFIPQGGIPEAGILDWFTVLLSLVAFFTLTAHGANFIAMKSDGPLQQRAQAIAAKAWWAVVLASVAALLATSHIRPAIWENYRAHWWGWVFPLTALGSTLGVFYFRARHQDGRAFLSCSIFIAAMAASTAFGLFPYMLPASTAQAHSLTVYNAAAPAHGLNVGLVWWCLGIALTLGYFAYLFHSFRGKVKLRDEGY